MNDVTETQIAKELTRISEQLEQIEKSSRAEEGLAVLWDVENVNPGNDVSFIEGFSDYVSQFGRLTVAQAFADWTRRPIKGLSRLLSEHHFELIHIPAARKNSADISLITYGIELALQHPDLKTFVLVTGDSDFRPLVKSLRRNGKRVIVICDMKTARADFLILADEYRDYRTLRPGGSTPRDREEIEEEIKETRKREEKERPEKTAEEETKALQEKRKNAYNLLTEAITKMKDEDIKPGIGLAKVRVQMLNPNFEEKELGFSSWSNFINAAQEEGFITVTGKGEGLILDVAKQKKEKTDQEKAFEMLLKVLKKHDKGEKPQYHNQAIIAEELYKMPEFSRIKEKLGYRKFKDFIQAAEVRKLVETEVDGLTHSIRRIN